MGLGVGIGRWGRASGWGVGVGRRARARGRGEGEGLRLGLGMHHCVAKRLTSTPEASRCAARRGRWVPISSRSCWRLACLGPGPGSGEG